MQSIDGENWLPVVGHDGYSVSDHGRVYSERSGKLLKLAVDPKGYIRAKLKSSAGVRNRRVHRLVLEAFVGPCPPGMIACHNDGVRSRNEVSNLRWDTPSENNYDKVRHGTDHERAKMHCPNGHLLQAPNLVAYLARKGQRGCLSCARARGWAHTRGVPFTIQKADEYFAALHD